jgi:hypothetical protein
MNILTFSEGLQKRLQEIQATVSNDSASRGKALHDIREVLNELKEFSTRYTFLNEQEEIHFFKEIKPVLMSQYYYSRKMFKLLLFDSFSDLKRRIDHYNRGLRRVSRFVRKNEAFYEYCMSGAVDRDAQYFVRNSNAYLGISHDKKFSTGYDLLLAKILANELIKDTLLHAIRKSESAGKPGNSLQWTTSKVALVEMIYALHASGVFDHGKTEIKKIIECFEEMFSVDLGNYARVFSEIRIRKKGQTNFLDQLRERLLTITEL